MTSVTAVILSADGTRVEGPMVEGSVMDGMAAAIERQSGAVTIGELVAFDAETIPLVTYRGQPGAMALYARSAIELCVEHIGHQVVLAFENSDPLRPIVIGRLRPSTPWPTTERPVQVEVDAEGRRLTLTATEQLVLRCGKASITLTSAGKVILQGAYVSSQSSGVLRIKGGSVQIN